MLTSRTGTVFQSKQWLNDVSVSAQSIIYDNFGRTQKILEGTNELLRNQTYQADGRINSRELGAGGVTYYQYYDDITENQLLRSIINDLGHLDLSYSYDVFGNLAEWNDNGTQLTRTYVYDSLERLLEANINDQCIGYKYDVLGNKIHQNGGRILNLISSADLDNNGVVNSGDFTYLTAAISSGIYDQRYDINCDGELGDADIDVLGEQIGEQGGTLGSSLVDYFPSAEFPHQLQSIPSGEVGDSQGNRYCYLNNGNLSRFGNRSFEYDHTGQMTAAYIGSTDSLLYIYDEAGGILSKKDESGWTLYLPGGLEYKPFDHSLEKYFFEGTQRIAKLNYSTGEVHYFLQDHLNSSSVTLDSSGELLERISYEPFGLPGSEGEFEDPTEYLYNDKRWEADYGFYDYGPRKMNPIMGRFIEADTIIPDPTDPQSYNPYSYTLNNPLKYVDPSGHAAEINWDRLPSNTTAGSVSTHVADSQETLDEMVQWHSDNPQLAGVLPEVHVRAYPRNPWNNAAQMVNDITDQYNLAAGAYVLGLNATIGAMAPSLSFLVPTRMRNAWQFLAKGGAAPEPLDYAAVARLRDYMRSHIMHDRGTFQPGREMEALTRHYNGSGLASQMGIDDYLDEAQRFIVDNIDQIAPIARRPTTIAAGTAYQRPGYIIIRKDLNRKAWVDDSGRLINYKKISFSKP